MIHFYLKTLLLLRNAMRADSLRILFLFSVCQGICFQISAMPDFYYGQKGNDDFTEEAIINFEDPLVKSLCVANWDTNGDSELSYGEARAVEDIGKIFYKTDITTFDELQYFSGLTTIPEWAFSNCRQLRSILLPETVREIRDNAFTYASALEAFHIPAAVESIGEAVFAGATNIQKLTLDIDNTHFMLQDDVLYQGIPAETLVYCPPYKNGTVKLPASVWDITGNAFYLCEKVTAIELNEGLVIMGDGAFQGCNALETLTLPASLENIGEGCFYCLNLKAIYVTEGNEVYQSIDGVLYLFDGNELIYYPPAREGASYDVLDGTGFIMSYSCYANHLEKVTLPASTKWIGDYALGLCEQLKVVRCMATEPPLLASTAFKDSNPTAVLYVPNEAIKAYQESPWAQAFPNILPVGIVDVNVKSVLNTEYYTLDGRRTSAPRKGLHIIRRADGLSKKALIQSTH